MVSGSISPPCSGYFSPFLHSTGTLSVFYWYLALRDGPRRFRQDSSCPALLRIPLSVQINTCKGLSPSTAHIPIWFHFVSIPNIAVLQPRFCLNKTGLGYSPFARHYSENRFFFLFLQVLRCFSSLRWHASLRDWPSASRVAPFGYPRIKSSLQIPAAFRSLPRPSSPIEAKASSVRP